MDTTIRIIHAISLWYFTRCWPMAAVHCAMDSYATLRAAPPNRRQTNGQQITSRDKLTGTNMRRFVAFVRWPSLAPSRTVRTTVHYINEIWIISFLFSNQASTRSVLLYSIYPLILSSLVSIFFEVCVSLTSSSSLALACNIPHPGFIL